MVEHPGSDGGVMVDSLTTMCFRRPSLRLFLLLLQCAIAAHALGDEGSHWSFKRLAEPAAGHSIDSFVSARLAEKGLQLSAEADRRTWLRRVTFDLTGLPPTPEQVAAFLADESSQAHERVVDVLLASARYGERWAQHWLDVVRYADTHGFEVNTPRPNAWPYRDYVIDAFNSDTPYDRFIREQLAGDTLGKGAATGFLVTAAVLLPGQIGKDDVSKRLARQDELGEIVINTGEAFLGLSIGCARCHDHKYDPVSAREYFAMQAFFTGVEYGDRSVRQSGAQAKQRELREALDHIHAALAEFVPLAGSGGQRPAVNARMNIERFAPKHAQKVRLVILSSNNLEPCLDELEVFSTQGSNIALASLGTVAAASGSKIDPDRHELQHINDGRYGNSRSWMSDEIGKGWVELDFGREHVIDRIVWGRDREGKFTDRLPLDYRVEVADASGEWQLVAGSTDREDHIAGKTADAVSLAGLAAAEKARAGWLLDEAMSLEEELLNYGDGGRLIYAGKFKEPEPSHVLHRGDPEQPLEQVPPAVPGVIGDMELALDAADHDRRQALASWIASPDNPLTARVMVNRIWQWHFGTGIVETANDFGRAGARPTHPELLDWLAGEFIGSGWSMKRMHKLIVLSATYRQSSLVDPVAQKVDSDVRFLWRFPSRRLEAETIRDSMLAVSGRLNLKTGGPGFDLFKTRGGLNGFPPIESFSGDGLRRMIYAHKIRMERESVFGAFDCPDAGQSSPRRSQSTTPIQALNLFNSLFTIEEAAAFANRIESEAGSDRRQQIECAYILAFGRSPDVEELADAMSIAAEHGLETLCRAIFNSNEFLFLP